MMQIVLHASDWLEEADAWQAILMALQAPDGHAQNLDALEKTLLDRPVKLELTAAPQELWPFLARIAILFDDLAADGVPGAPRFR